MHNISPLSMFYTIDGRFHSLLRKRPVITTDHYKNYQTYKTYKNYQTYKTYKTYNSYKIYNLYRNE